MPAMVLVSLVYLQLEVGAAADTWLMLKATKITVATTRANFFILNATTGVFTFPSLV